MLNPLNSILAGAADRHGWVFVDGVAEAFTTGHGYCAPWPDYGSPADQQGTPEVLRNRYANPETWYRNPGTAGLPSGQDGAGWYRTAGQSAALQGPDSRTETTGTMHPNELGHQAMAELLIGHLGD